MKGGIGSSSRLIELGDETFTIGVLVQSNYGASEDFRASTLPEGLAACDQGSIILIVATDLPLSCRQLRRVLRPVQRWYGQARFLHRTRQRGDRRGL